MAKKATTLHDNLGNDLLPVTNASITYMDDGNSVQAEIQDLKEKTQYNKGHYTTEQDLLTAYPNNIGNPQSRKGWYAIVGETDTVWIWDIEGNIWANSGSTTSAVESVNGLDGEVILTGGNINATATINDTSKTELINAHLTDIYSELDNKVDLDSSQIITGTKVFTETIGLANASEGTVDQIKHINSNFLITSGTGQNLLNIDEGLQTISAFNRELAYEDEISEIQGNYATKGELSQEIQNVTDMIPTDNLELTNGANYATEQYVQQNGGKIDTISVNGVQQDITNKNVNISVPTDYVTNQQLTDGLNSKQNNLTSSQLQAVNSGATSTNITQITTNASNIIDLQNNKASIDFVNSSIATNTATFRGTYNNVDKLPTTGVDNNDYAFVVSTDANGNTVYNKYKYDGSTWKFEYALNNSSFTSEQWASIQSGITSALVTQITTNKNDIVNKADTSALNTTNTNVSNLTTRVSTNETNIINLQNTKANESDLANFKVLTGTQDNPIIIGDLAVGNYVLTKDSYAKFLATKSSYLLTTDIAINVFTSDSTQTLFVSTIVASNGVMTGNGAYSLTTIDKSSSSAGAVPIEYGTELNGSVNYSTGSLSFYAPETSGTAGQLLQSNGSKKAPTWINNNYIDKEVNDLTNYTNNEELTTLLNAKQNKLSDTQLQAVNSGANSTNVAQISTNTNNINTINGKIPDTASSTNKLADVNFVNSSISTATATFKGTFNSVNSLPTTGIDLNDYAFVVGKDAAGNTQYSRYKYNGSKWEFEYVLNNSSFTADQWSAINSGITTSLTGKISTNEANITNLNVSKVDKTTTINGESLTGNVTLDASDIACADNSGMDLGFTNTQEAIDFVSGGLFELVGGIEQNSQTIGTMQTSINELGTNVSNLQTNVAQRVPMSRTVNGKSLSANITLNATDVGALPSNTQYVKSINGQIGDVTGIALTDDIPDTSNFITKDVNDLTNYKNNTQLTSLLNTKQNTITSSNKLPSSLISGLGTASALNTGTASGNVPVLGSDGKLPSAVVPASAITNTFVASSQSAMLGLSSADVGDICVRTDLNKSFILKATQYSTLSNWQELLTPTDSVLSVNGQTGAVNLTATEIPCVDNSGMDLGFTNTQEAIDFASGGLFEVVGMVEQNAQTIEAMGTALNEQGTTLSNLQTNVAQRVPTSRTINGKALTSNITLTASDVGALSSSASYVKSINGSSGAVTDVAKMAHTGPIDNNLLLIGIDPNNAMTTNDIQHANQIYIKDLALKTQFVTLTQSEYDALTTKDSNTYYFIKEE